MNKFIFPLIFIVFYFLGVNYLADVLVKNKIENDLFSRSGADLTLGFFDKVTASVVRPRWYGTIYEGNNQANLKVFNVVGLPIKVNGSNWAYFHLLALGGVSVYLYKIKKKEEKWESNLDGRLQYSSYYPM